MQSAKLVLGIEGGGTKTDWVLLRDGAVEKAGRLPAGNLRLNDDAALRRIFAELPREAAQVGVFLAGCSTAEDRARLERLCREAWPEARLALGGDRESAMAAAFAGGEGIIVISGTGAAVHGRFAGREERAGGWGHVVGDRGSGYDLARHGLRLALSRYDLDQRITPLAESILQATGLNTLNELAAWATRADKPGVSRLANAVFRAARAGDREMLETIEAGAEILAQFTAAVAQRLGFASPPVRLFGGIFEHHEDYVQLFRYRLSVLLPGAHVELCATTGAMGAAWLAARGEGAVSDQLSVISDDAELAAAATEQGNERSAALDEMSAAEIVRLFVEEENEVTRALVERRGELAAAVELVGAAMKAGGRLFYVGAGTSGRLGVLDASEIPPTFGAPAELVQGIIAGGAPALLSAMEGAEDSREGGALAVRERGVRAGDIVCGVTASGRTPFVLGALSRARETGARTLLLTCNPARRRAAEPWDIEIDLPTGPEIVTGSTRLKAGTATKVVLNLLSTAAMVRLGRVCGNAMSDLRISNEKLRDRGTRLVAASLGLDYAAARARLAAAGWSVRACLGGIAGSQRESS